MADLVWPIVSLLIACLVWDAIRKYLSRDELVSQVKAHGLQIGLQKKQIRNLESELASLNSIATATRDKLAAEHAARGMRSNVELKQFRFDRPK